jgi:hypothetical protein
VEDVDSQSSFELSVTLPKSHKELEPNKGPSKKPLVVDTAAAAPSLVASGYKSKFTAPEGDLLLDDGSQTPSGGGSFRSAHSSAKGNEDWFVLHSQLEKKVNKLAKDMDSRFSSFDLGLETDFTNIQKGFRQLEDATRNALSQAKQANTRLDAIVLQDNLASLTNRNRPSQPGTAPFDLSQLSSAQMKSIVDSVVAEIDLQAITDMIQANLHLENLNASIQNHSSRISALEYDLHQEHGVVPMIQRTLADMEARKQGGSCERGGYVFKGPEELDGLILSLGRRGKVYANCLDLYGLLTLAAEAYTTYESGIKVHADAIKANFDGVQESRIKLSFEVPYPEIIIKSVENSTTASKGGVKWAPMFASAEVFESNFRDGAYRRVMNGIDRAYELVTKALDHLFPISQRGSETGDMRKLHTILSDQNRIAYRQTTAFIDCLLPFHKTLVGGGLTSEEAWDRILVFVTEFLSCVQEERVLACADFSDESGIIWGCFKATDFAEDFRRQKFVEHPKALAILALTSIEREGKNLSAMEERVKKLIDSATKDKLTKIDSRVQTVETKVKNIFLKNPDLK